jgi:lipopolysaccharide/colanic/teichoic acid biosynthesis glycosyltransferase
MATEQFNLFQFRGSVSYTSYTPPVEVKKHTDEVREYLSRYIDLDSPVTRISKRAEAAEVQDIPAGYFQSFACLRKINSTNGINTFFSSVNEKLPVGGIFAVCAETLEQRRKRIFIDYPPSIPLYPYYMYDFLVNRVLPKLKITRKFYFKVKKNNNRVISLSEILGRLVFAGFRIIDIHKVNNLTYFITQKEREPISDSPPSYGFFFKMKRVGKDGKIIRVYKIRTMYPYSEFIQKFIYDNFNLSKGGKFNNDIRVTGWGKVLRKYWLDEMPMLFNWLKGELKIVGLRPISEHYLSLYNKDLAINRSTIKPGLIPPFYFDLPGTFDEIMKSEQRYLESYKSHPVKTDLTYFFQALKNILLKGARSS